MSIDWAIVTIQGSNIAPPESTQIIEMLRELQELRNQW